MRTSAGTMSKPRVRKDGTRTRSTSLHLPLGLGRDLAIHCAERGRKQNDVIVEAVARYLADQSADTLIGTRDRLRAVLMQMDRVLRIEGLE